MKTPGDEERRRIASALRALRMDADLSTTQLASRLGWSQSKVSKTELAQTRPKPLDVEAWALATGADPKLRDELVAIAEQSAGLFTEWRRELAPGRRRMQRDVERMEAAASVIRVFSMDVVSGLAQTRPYAEAMFRIGRQGASPYEPTEEIVQARLARQGVLDDEMKQFYMLMSEMALRRRLISPPAMRVQVDRLIQLSKRSNINVGVIPFDADERVHQYHAFAILGDPEFDAESIVLAESVTRAIRIRDRDEVAEYVAYFEALRSAALEGERLRAFLREVIADLPDS